MSEGKDVKITTVEKVKDPKKVEAGKKLAAMSKQANEKKVMEASNRESREEQAKQAKQEEFCFSNVDPLVALGAVGVLGLVVYHGYDRYNKFSKKSPNQDEVTTEIENQPSTSDTPKAAKVAKPKETTKDVKPKRVYRELDMLG